MSLLSISLSCLLRFLALDRYKRVSLLHLCLCFVLIMGFVSIRPFLLLPASSHTSSRG